MRGALVDGYQGWVRPHDQAGRFVLPASLSVDVLVKVEHSAVRPPEFVHGVRDGHSAIEGGCAPRYLRVALSPLGAYQVFGLPLDRLTGRLVDLREMLGADARLLGERRLFDNLPAEHVELDLVCALTTPDVEDRAQRVTHLRYRVRRPLASVIITDGVSIIMTGHPGPGHFRKCRHCSGRPFATSDWCARS